MAFLAPRALTITHGEQWRRLRRFNEATLQVGEAEAHAQFIADGVAMAFPGLVSDIGEIRKCMAQAMRTVVFGPGNAPAHVVEDVETLIRYVQSPARRMLFGWREAGRRRRFYEALRRAWREGSESGSPGLIAMARNMSGTGVHSEEELIEQIPHWMFAFTGSGADLLARTLAVVASRDDVYERARAEAVDQRSGTLHRPP